jgi:hypothetical protein
LRPGGLDPPDHAAVRVWSVKSIGAFIRTSPDAALAKGAPVDRKARLRGKAIRTRDRNPSDARWLAELQESDEAGTLVDPIDAGRPPRRKAPASPSAGPLGWG